jgi:hypothetical protein
MILIIGKWIIFHLNNYKKIVCGLKRTLARGLKALLAPLALLGIQALLGKMGLMEM